MDNMCAPLHSRLLLKEETDIIRESKLEYVQ